MAPTLERKITQTEIQGQLFRILTSEEFRRTETLGRMLRFIVEQTVAGDLSNLKEYFVGVEVFDRPRDFDPKNFALVRVQAIRLRRKLERFYLGSGAGDPIAIDVPKGAYVANFSRRYTVISRTCFA